MQTIVIGLAATQRNIHLIYVLPTNEVVTLDDQARVTTSLAKAVDWWHTSSNIISTQVISVSNPYNSLDWSIPYLIENNPNISIFVIMNTQSHKVLFGDSYGEAQNYYGAIWLVSSGVPGNEGLAATTTHELGHILYNLPDVDNSNIDIMNEFWYTTAYQMHFIGCDSLAKLDKPCKKVYLPYGKR